MAQSLYCAAAIEKGAMRFAYCALRAMPHPESGGYWIARSSRAMTVGVVGLYERRTALADVIVRAAKP